MKKDKQWRIRLSYFRQRYGLIIALIIAILISIFLSVQLWQSPGHITQKKQAAPAQQKDVVGKNLANIYGVSQLTFNDEKGNRSVMDFQSKSNQLISRVKKWHLTYKDNKTLSKNDYLKTLAKKDTVVMSFPDAISGSVIKHIFGKNIRIANDTLIDHVRLPKKGTDIALYSDVNRKMYRYRGSDASQTIKTAKKGEETIPVTYRWIGSNVVMVPDKPIQLQSYSYLLDSDHTVTQLAKIFPDSGKRTVTNDQELLTYTNGDNQRMTRNLNTGLIHYDAYGINQHDNTVSQRQKNGYQWLVDLHQLSDDLYYFEGNNKDKTLVYRLFVNGLPIFNQTDSGTVQVKHKPNHHEQIILSQYSLRVPLPTDKNKRVTLPTMDDALNDLARHGIATKDIQNMMLGYRWESNSEKQVVKLQPEWYFEQDGAWQSVDGRIAEGGR